MNVDQKREIRKLAARLVLRKPNLQLIPDTEDYPWFIRELQKQLQAQENRKELLLPNLRRDNESIAVFSDYGGESPDSRYNTYSFLVCAWNQTGFFHKAMAEVRDPLKNISISP